MRFSGKKLQQARRGIPASQFSFAAAMGISTRTQQRYETGDDVPDADYVAKAAERTAKPVDFFYEAEEAA